MGDRWAREGRRVIQLRDRSSSVQIFSQRFDDFYVYNIYYIAWRPYTSFGIYLYTHYNNIYTTHNIVYARHCVQLRFPRAAAHAAIVMPPPMSPARPKRRRRRRRLPWGKPRRRRRAYIAIIYNIVIMYRAYCVRARIRLRNGKNGFFLCVCSRGPDCAARCIIHIILQYNNIYVYV